MPGCQLGVSPDATMALVGDKGVALTVLAIPAAPTLVGQVVFAQAFAPARGANAANLLASPACRSAVGLWR